MTFVPLSPPAETGADAANDAKATINVAREKRGLDMICIVTSLSPPSGSRPIFPKYAKSAIRRPGGPEIALEAWE